jgi:ABC-type nitrate/sulfonate/bicarbonate transport system ATPase subunit
MGTLALRLSGAHLTLGHGARSHRVFSGLDLDVERGELLTILGPSGSGKSTLLSVLAGLTPLDAGTVEVLPGADGVAHAPAVVFQQPLLLPWRSVVDNVALGLSYRRHRHHCDVGGAAAGRRRWRSRGPARRAAARELLDRVGIAHLADRLPAELSGGQAQRAAIARAVVTRPSVLLLDEPFGALDARTRRELQDWLVQLRHAMGLTIVLVTHDLDEALLLGDRVGVLTGPDEGLDLTASDVVDRAALGDARLRDDLLARLGVGDARRAVVEV